MIIPAHMIIESKVFFFLTLQYCRCVIIMHLHVDFSAFLKLITFLLTGFPIL